MNKPLIVGITGGIGSGKTTLSRLLTTSGYPVYDTDREARRLQDEDPSLKQSISTLLGSEVYDEAGHLNRRLVAGRVFSNHGLLQELSKIVHPAVKQDFKNWLVQQKSKVVFIESAVLFEGQFNKLTDRNIVVTAPEEIRIQRVMQRDGVSREQVKSRINNQMPEEEKIAMADIVIQTEGGMPEKVMEIIFND